MDGRGEGRDDDCADIFERHLPVSFCAFAGELTVLAGKGALRRVDADDVVGQMDGVGGCGKMIGLMLFPRLANLSLRRSHGNSGIA